MSVLEIVKHAGTFVNSSYISSYLYEPCTTRVIRYCQLKLFDRCLTRVAWKSLIKLFDPYSTRVIFFFAWVKLLQKCPNDPVLSFNSHNSLSYSTKPLSQPISAIFLKYPSTIHCHHTNRYNNGQLWII